jgi:phosphoglycerate dehydrogenase-like enzyme
MFPELVESPVVVTHTRGVFEGPVAEFALALMLHFAKRLGEVVEDQRARRWRHLDTWAIAGATAGIVGFGEIGRRLARLCRCCGMRVLALRRGVAGPDPDADVVYSRAQLGELLSRADYVVLTVPLTAETRGLIGAAALRQMRSGSYLINVGRGGVVDEVALAQALREGWIAGAALDVVAQEPLPPEHPLYDVPNLVISSHMAGDVVGWEDRVLALFFENFRRFARGEPLRFVVDKRRGY